MTTSCRFRFGLLDVTARGDASFVVTQNQSFADIDDVNTEQPITFPPVATLEPDFGWPVNGTKTIMPDNPAALTWGWWSAGLSGAGGAFATAPTLTVTFADSTGTPTPHSSVGITLYFYATLPGSINVKWYGMSGSLLENQDFIPDSFEYFCDLQVENYQKIVITVPSMQYADRYLRMTRLLFGSMELLDGARVTKAALTEELDPSLQTLPMTALDLSFYTPDGRFSLLDPQGAFALFQWKQEIEAYKTIDGAESYMGRVYLEQAEGSVDAVTTLSCVGLMGVLDAVEYKGGLYSGMALSAFVDDILTPEGIAYTIDPALAGVTLTGWLPITTKRAALQQSAFAAGVVIDETRGTTVRIYPLPTGSGATVGPARKITGHKVTLEDLVTEVDVTAHTYVLGSEITDLASVTLAAGRQTITFDGPVSITSVSGATLIESHVNYCILNMFAQQEATVSGYEYHDVTSVYAVSAPYIPAGGKSGLQAVTGATLVDPTKAQAVAQRLYDYYQNRYTDAGRLLPGGERPAQRVNLSSMGGKTLTGYLERVVTDLTGGCLENVTIRGAGS
jgi:hypothetical protein